MSEKQNIKRGYLHENYQIFHIKDKSFMEFKYHYHDFQKIVIFISGNVTYQVEGKAYKLKPWDVLFLSSREVHKPIIDPSVVYERIIIWLNEGFYKQFKKHDGDLSTCFNIATKNHKHLLRMNTEDIMYGKSLIKQLEYSRGNTGFASKLLNDALLVQLLVHFNRVVLEDNKVNSLIEVEYNQKIEKVIRYINSNLDKDLSIDHLVSELNISKYYLMHSFKEVTGHTIHKYILQKKMFIASEYIKSGKELINISNECGFKDYSSFFRSFKKTFAMNPREYQKKHL